MAKLHRASAILPTRSCEVCSWSDNWWQWRRVLPHLGRWGHVTRSWPWMSPYPIPLLKRGTHYSSLFRSVNCYGYQKNYDASNRQGLQGHHSDNINLSTNEQWTMSSGQNPCSVDCSAVYRIPIKHVDASFGTMLRCRLTNLRFCYFWLVRTLVRSTILLFLAARGRWGGDLLKMDLLIFAYLCAHLVRSPHWFGESVQDFQVDMSWFDDTLFQRSYSSTVCKWCRCWTVCSQSHSHSGIAIDVCWLQLSVWFDWEETGLIDAMKKSWVHFESIIAKTAEQIKAARSVFLFEFGAWGG